MPPGRGQHSGCLWGWFWGSLSSRRWGSALMSEGTQRCPVPAADLGNLQPPGPRAFSMQRLIIRPLPRLDGPFPQLLCCDWGIRSRLLAPTPTIAVSPRMEELCVSPPHMGLVLTHSGNSKGNSELAESKGPACPGHSWLSSIQRIWAAVSAILSLQFGWPQSTQH